MALAFAAALWVIYAGAVHAIAGHYAGSSSPEDWSRAARMEPANGENWYRMGRYRQLDFDHSDIPVAISDYQRAVELNPESSFYKLDLASALEMAGKNAEAEQYFRAAQKNYPMFWRIPT
jgi:tetratricopeptide (TPR) repeat protein